MNWAALVFGWEGALTSVLVSTVGLIVRRAELLLVGALVGFPFMLYLFGTPRFWLVATIAAPCHFGAAVALRRRRVLAAWGLFAPTPLVMWYVAAAITGGVR